MEDMASSTRAPMLERKVRPQEQLNCPRCNSTNTKFCYYNNYSLTQPRYFCKTCRRYWTEGGSLRNVPVGGGSRKNKRSISSSLLSSSSSSSSKLPDLNPQSLPRFSSQNPRVGHEGHDLNLAFPVMQESQCVSQYADNNNNSSSASHTSSPLSALELLRTGMASRGMNSFIPDSNTAFSTGLIPMQEFKPTISFSIDGLGGRYPFQENGGRILFPFGELKQLSTTEVDSENKGQGSSSGYWNGMLGGGSW